MTFILLFLLYLLLRQPHLIAEQISSAAILWWSVLVPTMYPSFIIIDLLEQMPLIRHISRWIFPIFKKIFKINCPKSAFIILFSLICGAPASTKMIANAYENKELTKKEYENLVCAFSCLSMPYIFYILSQHQLSILLFYLAYLLLAILWMHLFQKKEEPLLNSVPTHPNYSKCFFSSISKNIQVLFNILGILVIFRVLMSLIFKNEPVFYPYFEILGGLNHANHNLIIVSALGFMGFSLHLQILSFLEDFSYPKFLLSRIYFSLIGVITFF